MSLHRFGSKLITVFLTLIISTFSFSQTTGGFPPLRSDSNHRQPNGIALTQIDAKPDFSWNSSQNHKSLEKVRFENGDVAVVVSNQPLPEYQRVKESCALQRLEIGKEGSRLVTDACDSHVNIIAAFPSATNAKIAIVETKCGGTACDSFDDVYIVLIASDRLRMAKVGTSFYEPKGTTYQFWFNGKKIKRSVVQNFFDGEKNNLGDLVPSTRNFVNPGAYVDTRFKKEFEQFIGVHPLTFMGNSSARSRIVKFVKPEEFRQYRNALSVASDSFVSNGRFIVMNGCMAHNCDVEFASVVIDGFNGETRIMRFDKKNSFFAYASTNKLDPNVDRTWLEDVDTHDWMQVHIKTGRLVAQKK